jgi:hypothetical protein
MSLDLAHLIESAADEVAQAGRAAAGSLNELVHDWGQETRSFVSDHAPSLPVKSLGRKRSSVSVWRIAIPALVVAAVVVAVLRRRRASTPHVPQRNVQDEVHETVVTSSPKDDVRAQGAAAS